MALKALLVAPKRLDGLKRNLARYLHLILRMISTRDSHDSVQMYLRQMARYPRLTATQEADAAERLVTARRHLRACILSNDFVLQKVAHLLERLQQRKSRLDHNIGFSAKDSGERRRVVALLPGVLEHLRRALRDNRADFTLVMKRSLSAEQRSAAWRRIVVRRRRAAAAVSEMGVRLRHLRRWQRQFETLVAEMQRLSQQLTAGLQRQTDERRDVRNQLHRTVREATFSPATAQRRLACCHCHERQYEDTKQFLVSSNLRLVVAIAKRYRNRGVSFLDLIQEGNAGLLQAADRWEPAGSKFSTYATWWVRQSIREALHIQPRTIRLPEQVMVRLRRIQHAKNSLMLRHGFRPDVEAIAAQAGMSAEQAERMLRLQHETYSLDQPISSRDQTGAAMSDMIVDPRRDAFNEALTSQQLKSRLAVIMTELNERQRTVLSLRFGLLDGLQRTLEEVGRLLSMTREGVRQIEMKALERLRHPTRRRQLLGLVDFHDMHEAN